MQQTEQFKLNQWQKDDRIRMEDFNADNLKLENALISKLGHPEIISADAPLGDFCSAYNTTLGFDWDKWEFACFLAELPHGLTGSKEPIEVKFTGEDSVLATIPEESYAIVFWCRHNKELPVRGLLLCSKPMLFTSSLYFKDLDSIFVKSTGNRMPAPAKTKFGIA
ncbi:MAG: hypothetical protein HFF87_06770 [Oscillibacter sp.]|nr:hypothetical protein [Oscillibacter sp.]